MIILDCLGQVYAGVVFGLSSPYKGDSTRFSEVTSDNQHSLVFRGLTDSQRTLGFGVSQQFLLFSKLYYRSIGKNMGLPSEANVLENLPKQSWSSSEMICWTVSQPHSPEIHPVKFLSKTFSFFFQFFMSCTHLISRLPQCI